MFAVNSLVRVHLLAAGRALALAFRAVLREQVVAIILGYARSEHMYMRVRKKGVAYECVFVESAVRKVKR